MNPKSFFLIFLLLLTVYRNYGQVNASKVIPASPEVASFAKNIDIPVGYSSGTPQINIPLVGMKSGPVQVSVALSYNASGIRVEETPTWIGLGWNLGTGGNLSRSVRGLPDDYSGTGYMYTTYKVNTVDMDPSGSFMAAIRDGQLNPGENLDTEPDIFSFSAMGYSGKFFYNQDSGRFIMAPYQNIKIEYFASSPIPSFVLIFPDGVKCYFGISENGLRSSYEKYLSQYTTTLKNATSSGRNSNTPVHYTSWSLMDIVSPSGEAINFYYTTDPLVREFGRGGESITYEEIRGSLVAIKNASYYRQDMSKPVLDRIISQSGTLTFFRAPQNRLDVYSDGKALDSIVLSNSENKRIKGFFFEHDYFISDDNVVVPWLSEFTEVAKKRLYLRSVMEITDASAPPYIFSYHSRPLPSRLSASQDYWGYYNGKNNGIDLLPRLERIVDGLIDGYMLINGNTADRRVDTNYAQAGILTKITYPTGGTSEFKYESNKASTQYYDALSGVERSDLLHRNVYFPRFIDANNPNALLYLDSFTVGDIVSKVNINAQLGGCPVGTVSGSCRFNIYILGKTDPNFSLHINMSNTFSTVLPQAEYYIKAVIAASADPVPAFNVQLQWDQRTDPYNFIVGGLRVRNILYDDGSGKKTGKNFGYHFPGSPHLSSGILVGIPTHTYYPTGSGGTTLQRAVVSNSPTPLSSDGQTVRYVYVTEFMDTAKSSFKTEYTFSNDWATAVGVTGNQVVIPQDIKEWRSNQLLNKKVFETVSPGNYRILMDEWNYYKTHQSVTQPVGIYIWSTPAQAKMVNKYNTTDEWYLLDSTQTTSYVYPAGQQQIQQMTTKTTYNSKYLPAKTVTISSIGKKLESKTWYPFDYEEMTGFNIAALQSQNIIQVPVKQEISVNGKIRSGNVIRYNANGLPIERFNYESPVLNDTIVHNRNIIVGNYYVSKQRVDYIQSNPVQILENGMYSSFMWDYAGNYPIAETNNAPADQIAYTSFEADGWGGWTMNPGSVILNNYPGITGRNTISGGVQKVMPVGNYVVSFWSIANSWLNGQLVTYTPLKIVGPWRYYEITLSNISSINVAGDNIDEIRLYPKGAQMTTYTYDPLIGMTSQCDAAGRITYYEYDGFGRLKVIRDENKNVLKTFDYQYQKNYNQ